MYSLDTNPSGVSVYTRYVLTDYVNRVQNSVASLISITNNGSYYAALCLGGRNPTLASCVVLIPAGSTVNVTVSADYALSGTNSSWTTNFYVQGTGFSLTGETLYGLYFMPSNTTILFQSSSYTSNTTEISLLQSDGTLTTTTVGDLFTTYGDLLVVGTETTINENVKNICAGAVGKFYVYTGYDTDTSMGYWMCTFASSITSTADDFEPESVVYFTNDVDSNMFTITGSDIDTTNNVVYLAYFFAAKFTDTSSGDLIAGSSSPSVSDGSDEDTDDDTTDSDGNDTTDSDGSDSDTTDSDGSDSDTDSDDSVEQQTGDITLVRSDPSGYYQSIVDYMGIPFPNTETLRQVTENKVFPTPDNLDSLSQTWQVNALPFRAYNLIYNEWFRDENLIDSVTVNTDDGVDDGSDYVLLKRGKRHDYFTSALPWTQKGEAPTLQFSTDIASELTAENLEGTIPVAANADLGNVTTYAGAGVNNNAGYDSTSDEFAYFDVSTNQWRYASSGEVYGDLVDNGDLWPEYPYRAAGVAVMPDENGNIVYMAQNAYNKLVPISNPDVVMANTPAGTSPTFRVQVPMSDLMTAIQQNLTFGGITINEFREAFQIQMLLETDARGGTRYTEILRAHFGVISPDARLQRPEYLGGSTSLVNINSVAQTSSTDATSPIGYLGAYGVVANSYHGFNKSFTEHGYIIGICNIRADLTYQQGLNRLWTRQTRYDFYWPLLAHLGEQSILNKEIYYQNDSTVDDEVFGYQERYAEYRYYPSMITGLFRSSYRESLDFWHIAQDFENLPVLNQEFIEEAAPIERVIAVPDEPHFLLDIWYKDYCTRPMPTYSVPGLITHF